MTAPLDACAPHVPPRSSSDADLLLGRAADLVQAATTRLRDHEEQLDSMYSLTECLLEVGPPVAILEASEVRAWSPALAAVTGVPSNRAVGRRLSRVLPALQAAGKGRWRWSEADGVEWTVALRQVGHRLEVLCWTPQPGGSPSDAISGSSAHWDDR